MKNNISVVDGFGAFSTDGREYILKNIKTPRPWIHYVSNDDYCVLFSQTGAGYSFYKAPHAYKITFFSSDSYTPTHPEQGRSVFVKDNKTGKFWDLIPQQESKHKNFECRYGLGYVNVSGEKNGIAGNFRIFVPNKGACEIWTVTVKNNTKKAADLSLFPFIQWYLSNYPGSLCDPQVYKRTWFDKKEKAIVAWNYNPENIFPYGATMMSSAKLDGFDCSKFKFAGPYNSVHSPKTLEEGGECGNTEAAAEPDIAVFQHNIKLKPGQEKKFHIVVGTLLKQKGAGEFRKYIASDKAVEKEFADLKAYWDKMVNKVNISTPDKELNDRVNVWIKYQLHQIFRFTRGLDRGYRDVLQDMRGFMALDAKKTKDFLLKTLSYQNKNGEAMRQWNSLGAAHDLRKYMDSPVWMPETLNAYLKETGDYGILKIKVPYVDGGSDTVYAHALKALTGLYDKRGKHKMCYMGHGDWNDALNQIGRQGKGESVWLTVAVCFGILKMKEIAVFIKDNKTAEKLQKMYDTLKKDINKYAWDGNWYVYAFNDHGKPIGSKSNDEGKMHLNVQTWAIFSGVAEGDRLKKCLAIVDNELDTDCGPVLLKPSYSYYNNKIGRISAMLPGFFENGSIYLHGASFKYKADAYLKRMDIALKGLRKTLAGNPKNTVAHASVEPFSTTNFYTGVDAGKKFGIALYSWFTGSINWFFNVTMEDLLGIKPDFDGLVLEPNFPEGWKNYTVVREFRGATYNIECKNVSAGKSYLVLCDGKVMPTNKVPLFKDGKTHYIKVFSK